MSRRTAALLSAAATFFVFLPALGNGFVDWDDQKYLLASREHLGFAFSQLKWMFTTTLSGPYQPLSWLSLALDYSVWGANPAGFHLTSLLFHSANAALVCLIAWEILSRGRADKDDALAAVSLFAALLFALHPLRVESVAWASERRDVLCGFFYLSAILLYLRGRVREALAAFSGALLSKGMAVTLPLVLPLLDHLLLERRAWAEKIPFFLLSLVFGLVGWAGQAHFEAGGWPAPDWNGRLAQAAYGLVFYLGKTLWPADLSPLYLRPPRMSLLAAPFSACAAAAATTTAASVLLRRRSPGICAAWLCYGAALAPVLGLVPFGRQLAADRYSYLPCVPLALLAADALRRVWKNGPARSAAAFACLALSALTWRQLPVWRDSASLWARVVDAAPNQPMPRNSLGYALEARGQFDEAAEQYRRAIALDATYDLPHNNLGNTLTSRRDNQGAEAEYRRALALRPDYWEARSNLGLALARQNKLSEAAQELEQAARLKPDAAGIHKNLGLVYRALGRERESDAEQQRAETLSASAQSPQ